MHDLLVALEPVLELLHHTIVDDGDDRRLARLQALADRLEVLVLESLVADLAPQAPRSTADSGRGNDARREDQADDSAGDRASLRPGLAARIRGLLESNLSVRSMNDDDGVDEV